MIDFEQDRLACVKTIQPLSQMANQCLDSLLQLWGACISHCDLWSKRKGEFNDPYRFGLSRRQQLVRRANRRQEGEPQCRRVDQAAGIIDQIISGLGSAEHHG